MGEGAVENQLQPMTIPEADCEAAHAGRRAERRAYSCGADGIVQVAMVSLKISVAPPSSTLRPCSTDNTRSHSEATLFSSWLTNTTVRPSCMRRARLPRIFR